MNPIAKALKKKTLTLTAKNRSSDQPIMAPKEMNPRNIA